MLAFFNTLHVFATLSFHYMYITTFAYVLQPSAYRMLVTIKRQPKGSVLGTVVCLPGEYYRYIFGFDF